ncbi:hypothetical protein [Streptomyces lancefieldiae]|uniref:Uncharacterized protein n=1 Tax=Streptomyces lancefieldiae TaxID=3075520 RepID=A0ABU3AW41_9ACTN|nr:hypothetical protein [Streptomyces sp. DSM 40712]MDT0614407.1 hypothetical protein [Streptomyces sp. DSM 40712]
MSQVAEVDKGGAAHGAGRALSPADGWTLSTGPQFEAGFEVAAISEAART